MAVFHQREAHVPLAHRAEPDARGHGDSSRPDGAEAFHWANFGRDALAVAEKLTAGGGPVALGLGQLITQIIDTLSGGNIFLMLVITAIASLIIGMGLPTTATYIVMASLTAPAIVTIGGMQGFIVPLMAAHLFCFYFGILADDTPPVGLAAYAAAASRPNTCLHFRTSKMPAWFVCGQCKHRSTWHSWGPRARSANAAAM